MKWSTKIIIITLVSFAKYKISLFSSCQNDTFLEINETEEAYNCFHQKLAQTFNKSFPLQEIKMGYDSNKPWLTDSLKRSIKVKNKLYVKSMKTPILKIILSIKNIKID